MTRRTFLVLFAAAVAFVPLAAFAQESQGFVPLTNIPGITEASDTGTFPTFFNTLYRLAIGAAVVIAILQIMRAGAYFMFNKGSVAHNEKAKGLIASSVLGLLLVLSPVIVFSIINPEILELELDVSKLQRENVTVNQWFEACDASTTAEQRTCLRKKEGQIASGYQECIKNSPVTNCISQAESTLRIGVRGCIDEFKAPTQSANTLSCLDKEVDNYLKNNLGADTSQKGRSCEVWDLKTAQVVQIGNECPAGKEVMEAFCTSLHSSSQTKVCASKRTAPITNKFWLAYYYDTTAGDKCRQVASAGYLDQGECQRDLERAQDPKRNGVGAPVTVIKRCEVAPVSYTPPKDPNVTYCKAPVINGP
jgi:hypothetical protein